jgi:hypothetical protein
MREMINLLGLALGIVMLLTGQWHMLLVYCVIGWLAMGVLKNKEG